MNCQSMYSFSVSAVKIILALLEVTSSFEVERVEEISIYFMFIVTGV